MSKKQIPTKKIIFFLPLLFGAWLFSYFGVSFASAKTIAPENIIALVNESRREAGLANLAVNATLTEAANAKARDMQKGDYFAHTSPTGKSPWYWIKRSGYQYRFAGENLAINYYSAEEQHAAWMKSATHRANILSDRYQETGVAVAEGKINGTPSLVVVQVFATPVQVLSQPESLTLKENSAPIGSPSPATEPEVPTVLSEAAPQLMTELSPASPTEPALPQMAFSDPKLVLIERLMIFTSILLQVLLSLAAPIVFLAREYQSLAVLFTHRREGVTQVFAPG